MLTAQCRAVNKPDVTAGTVQIRRPTGRGTAHREMSSSDEPPSCGVNSSSIPTKNYQLSSKRRAGMQTSVLEGSFSIAHVTLTGPAFLTGYLVLNGATDFQLGLMLAIPYFLMIFQLVAAYLTSFLGSRKGLCAIGVACFRGIHVFLAILPFIPGLTNQSRLWIIFSVLLFSHLSFMLLANTWWMWMADLVPDRIRGRYFGFKSALALIFGTFWSLAGGALLDYYRSQGDPLYGFCILFCVASAFALIGLLFLMRQYEPPMKRDPVPSFREIFGILKNDNFRCATLFMFIWNFGVGLMVVLTAKHMLGYLNMSFTQLMLYPVIINIVGFGIARYWGRLMDHVGTRTTLLLCGLAAGLVPLLWLFTKPGTLWPIWVDAVATGLFMTGMNIAAVNLPLVVTPKKNRLYYLAVFATVSGLGIGIASVLSGHIAMMLSGLKIRVPGTSHVLINYHIIFAMSAFFRLGSMWLLLQYQDEKGRSLSHAIGRIGAFLAGPFHRKRQLATPQV